MYGKPSLFRWDDNGRPMNFTNWHKCEPNGETYENCIEMYSHYYPYPANCYIDAVAGNWNDIPCDTNIKNAIVCKKLSVKTKSDAED